MDTNQAVNTIREKLFALKDEKYASFSASLVPNVERERFIGVRTPQLRALAKELCGTEAARLFPAALPHYYQEENCLQGFLAERIKDEGELYAALHKDSEYARKLASLPSALFPSVSAEPLGEDAAHRLYGARLGGGIKKIEKIFN